MAEPVRGGRGGRLGEGAAQEAPTAPHATPRTGKGPRTGPERFWSRWPVRFALAVSLVVSGLAHCTAMPFDLKPSLEIQEVDGEAAIPVDLFEPQDTPPPPPPPPPEEVKPSPADDKGAGTAPTATSRPLADAGAPRDAAIDGAADGSRDGALALPRPTDGGLGLDGAIASADAGPASLGPRDPQAIVGAAGDIQVDKVLVMAVINAEIIKKSSVAPALAQLLKRVDQWDQFMHGTDIDPVNDIDWIIVSGPSLQDTRRDVVLVHYSTTDAKVSHAMDVVAGNYAAQGATDAFDAGVDGMKAVRSKADGTERVVMLPHPHVLAVVPSSAAPKVAQQLLRARTPAHLPRKDALYLRVFDPHHPMPQLPASITELRVSIVPTDDGGADVLLEGDTASPEAAADAARAIDALVKQIDASPVLIPVKLSGADVLADAEFTSDGAMVKGHLHAEESQIVSIIGMAGFLPGVLPAASPHPSPSSSSAPRPKSSH